MDLDRGGAVNGANRWPCFALRSLMQRGAWASTLSLLATLSSLVRRTDGRADRCGNRPLRIQIRFANEHFRSPSMILLAGRWRAERSCFWPSRAKGERWCNRLSRRNGSRARPTRTVERQRYAKSLTGNRLADAHAYFRPLLYNPLRECRSNILTGCSRRPPSMILR